MAEYIEREALLNLVRPDDPDDEKAAVTIATAKKLCRSLANRVPAADVEPVNKELRKTVKMLHVEYEKAKKQPFVRDPLAYALYHVWKMVDGGADHG